jgi:hypothetical protein
MVKASTIQSRVGDGNSQGRGKRTAHNYPAAKFGTSALAAVESLIGPPVTSKNEGASTDGIESNAPLPQDAEVIDTMNWTWSQDGTRLLLVALSPNDHRKAQDALDELAGSRESQGEIIADRLRSAITSGDLSLELLEEFSKWCHTGSSYAGSQAVAEQISRLFFGIVIPRLRDQANRRVPTYEADLMGLKTRLGVDDGKTEPGRPEPLSPDEGSAPTEDTQPFALNLADTRKTVLRQIKERQGQPDFRAALRERYGDRCMISGCTIIDIVEAAHIKSYQGNDDNHPENGLLLRADLHTLFDLHLIGLEPGTLKIRVRSEAKKDGYEVFDGQTLRYSGAGPSPEAVVFRWKQFVQRDGLL